MPRGRSGGSTTSSSVGPARVRWAILLHAGSRAPILSMVSSHRITTLSSPIWCDDAASGRSHVVQVTRTVAEVRASVRAARRAGRRIGLVPTMGFLHDGHLSLIRRAAADCDDVIVSVFVNPTQFNDAADLAAYPRDEARDVELAVSAGATMVFAPPVEEVYPRHFAISVHVRAPITETLEGAVRGPEHFWGVATVVTKLFGMVQPGRRLLRPKGRAAVRRG